VTKPLYAGFQTARIIRLHPKVKARRPHSEPPPTRVGRQYLCWCIARSSRTPIQYLSAGNEWLKPGAWGSVTKGRTEQKRRGFRPTVMGRSRRQISSPFHPHLLKLMLMGSRRTIRRVHMRRCTSEFRNPQSAFRILPRRSVWKRRVTLFLR
jgi:hypothetical protein